VKDKGYDLKGGNECYGISEWWNCKRNRWNIFNKNPNSNIKYV